MPASPLSLERLTITETVALLLILLEELRMQTNNEVGFVAIATARMWVVDGIRHLDRMAKNLARTAAVKTVGSGRADLVWRRVS